MFCLNDFLKCTKSTPKMHQRSFKSYVQRIKSKASHCKGASTLGPVGRGMHRSALFRRGKINQRATPTMDSSSQIFGHGSWQKGEQLTARATIHNFVTTQHAHVCMHTVTGTCSEHGPRTCGSWSVQHYSSVPHGSQHLSQSPIKMGGAACKNHFNANAKLKGTEDTSQKTQELRMLKYTHAQCTYVRMLLNAWPTNKHALEPFQAKCFHNATGGKHWTRRRMMPTT